MVRFSFAKDIRRVGSPIPAFMLYSYGEKTKLASSSFFRSISKVGIARSFLEHRRSSSSTWCFNFRFETSNKEEKRCFSGTRTNPRLNHTFQWNNFINAGYFRKHLSVASTTRLDLITWKPSKIDGTSLRARTLLNDPIKSNRELNPSFEPLSREERRRDAWKLSLKYSPGTKNTNCRIENKYPSTGRIEARFDTVSPV